MSEAGLDLRLGKHGVDRFAKAFEAIDYGDQDFADTAVLELLHHRQPELAGVGLLHPNAEHVLAPIRGHDASEETALFLTCRALHCVMTLPLATSSVSFN